jgi:putative transposase
MAAVDELSPIVGVQAACDQLGVPRASYYRALSPPQAQAADDAEQPQPDRAANRSPRALSDAEREHILTLVNSERFADLSPREIYATLLDEGSYVCSWPTIYRLLRQQGQTTRRRDRPHRPYQRPELLAKAPRQLWSWDITKLKGPQTWTYFYLYVILDVFSRYVVGWMIAPGESAELAEMLIGETCRREQIGREQLTLHADRGSSMRSKCVSQLLVDLGVARTHSRPHVSNDNPFSEAQFKTAKYHPSTPERFGSLEDARGWASSFFEWYNHEHHHTSLGLLTPATVHDGRAEEVLRTRKQVLAAAYHLHPERFVRGQPQPQRPPEAVWINPPQSPESDHNTFSPPAERSSPPKPGSAALSRGFTAERPLDRASGPGYAGAERPMVGENPVDAP